MKILIRKKSNEDGVISQDQTSAKHNLLFVDLVPYLFIFMSTFFIEADIKLIKVEFFFKDILFQMTPPNTFARKINPYTYAKLFCIKVLLCMI